jgi:general secretion pathway protein F
MVATLPIETGLRLTVQGPDGRVQSLTFADATQEDAMRRAVSRGFKVLAIEGPPPTPVNTTPGHTRFGLLLFSQELLALLEAGLNLNEALGTLHAKERQAGPREILSLVLRSLSEGQNFSDVLERWPRHFPPVYVATVRAGDLPAALGRYIHYQQQFEAVRKKLVSAAIYPSMLLIVGGVVTLFLLGYVVPRFSVVYAASNRELPWMSALLLRFGQFIAEHSAAALLAAVASAALLGWTLSQRAARAWLVRQVLSVPGLSTKVHEFQLARFYRAVSLLLAAGIALPKAMGMVTGLLSAHQQLQLARCRMAVEQGSSLSSALVAAGLATVVSESLIKVGERSGQMAEMLERTARFADDDFSRWVDWASRLLEPALMTLIGLVIGTVVVLMYLPIFELAGSLQ